MATASHVQLSPSAAGVLHASNIQSSSAEKASELLQENHDKFHMYFRPDGFHNHIAHHLMTIFALGATQEEIQKAFDVNKSYQRPAFPVEERIVQDMSSKEKFAKYLGKEKYFHDYMVFFQKELETKGWEVTLNEHLFARDDHANAMLTRLFSGFLHPVIHLGFGIEFKQPAIMAEALAQAATHDNWISKYLLGAEKMAKEIKSDKSLIELMDAIPSNDKLAKAAHWEDANKIRDGLLVRAPDELLAIASQWQVREDQLEKKTAEMINADAYFTGGAQNPPKEIRFDFYYIHCMNCSIFFSAFLKEHWISNANKARLLEWKGRIDLAMYPSRGTPKLLMNEITDYKPKNPNDGWEGIFRRIDKQEDDGHASKLIRAFANGEQACKPFEESENWPIKGKMWLQLGHMAVDSVERPGDRWGRSVGFPQAWEKYQDRPKL